MFHNFFFYLSLRMSSQQGCPLWCDNGRVVLMDLENRSSRSANHTNIKERFALFHHGTQSHMGWLIQTNCCHPINSFKKNSSLSQKGNTEILFVKFTLWFLFFILGLISTCNRELLSYMTCILSPTWCASYLLYIWQGKLPQVMGIWQFTCYI